MKRAMISMLMFAIAFVAFALQTNLNGYKAIKLEYRTPNSSVGTGHRTPATPIYGTQDGYNIVFAESYAGDTIEVFDGNTLLYINIIGEDGSVEIPENIVGGVELRLIVGERTYSTEIEL